MDKIEKQIVDSIDNFSDDILDFTCRLVAEPSTLGNEASALEVMERELKKLQQKVKERGYTIVPFRLYVDDRGFAKLDISLVSGKKSYDKRESIKQKDSKRDLDRLKKLNN